MDPKRALIVGFLGRKNSGDDVMFELHKELLARLGFNTIAWWTEFQKDSSIGTTFKPNTKYDLVVVGGGSLDFGYGMHAIMNARFTHGSKIIYSSITYPKSVLDYQLHVRLIQSVADLIILRDKIDFDDFPEKAMYLQDIATVYRPDVPTDRDAIAIVVRKDVAQRLDFAPAEPFDVLVLSEEDGPVSARYAEKAGARAIYFLDKDHPKAHVDAIRRYKRVISMGRLHAALYALDREVLFLFGSFPGATGFDLPPVIRPLTWEQLKEVNRAHSTKSKVGIDTGDISLYGHATMDQYAEAFERVLKS